MNEQYYRIMLNDYDKPAFVTFDKAYYGSLQQVRTFIEALEQDKRTKRNHEPLIKAFREYESGNTEVTHPVCFHEAKLLTPIKCIGTKQFSLGPRQWDHINIWGFPNPLRYESVDVTFYWFSEKDSYCRCLTAQFQNLEMESLNGKWHPLADATWGHPHMVELEDACTFNRLAVVESRFEKHIDLLENFQRFQVPSEVDFTEFCNDIFGDG